MYADEKLAEMFGLPKPGRYTQDWEFETSVEPEELPSLIDKFEQSDLTPHEKTIMMTVFVGSLNDMIHSSPPPEWKLHWERISRMLTNDLETYSNLIQYWKRSHVEPEDRFAVSQLFHAEFPAYPA